MRLARAWIGESALRRVRPCGHDGEERPALPAPRQEDKRGEEGRIGRGVAREPARAVEGEEGDLFPVATVNAPNASQLAGKYPANGG